MNESKSLRDNSPNQRSNYEKQPKKLKKIPWDPQSLKSKRNTARNLRKKGKKQQIKKRASLDFNWHEKIRSKEEKMSLGSNWN